MLFKTPDTIDNTKSLHICNRGIALGEMRFFFSRIHTKEDNLDNKIEGLNHSALVLAFVSNNFSEDDDCRKLLLHVKDVLRKPFVIAAVGENFNWKTGKIGIHLQDMVKYLHRCT